MRKIIIQCIGNILLFALFGLTFLYPFSNLSQLNDFGFSATLSIFPLLLIIYLIAYPIIYYVCRKKFKWNKNNNSELAFSDEREKIIVAEAGKAVYKVAIGGLMLSIAIIGGIRFISLFTHKEISIYSTSVLLLTALLIVCTITYCAKWLIEYRK